MGLVSFGPFLRGLVQGALGTTPPGDTWSQVVFLPTSHICAEAYLTSPAPAAFPPHYGALQSSASPGPHGSRCCWSAQGGAPHLLAGRFSALG